MIGTSLNLEALISQYYKNLNSNDMIVLNYIMQHKKECISMNISRLSSECSISTASIVRTMKKLGFSGYSEFKFLLKGQDSDNTAPTLYREYVRFGLESKETTG
ncbi:MurR/RpiR family transcriptional regulator [Dorea longicatena]|nr:MurR/RpiR family transcriptional regulator [Dorea longicatena]